ncbi:MAG: tetratricopeptide repeat protein [Candidatus Obscuribacterales bacterium]|nr:tetratricopeptide repeat protein [Candidatus Obscuribacterales bacterium]
MTSKENSWLPDPDFDDYETRQYFEARRAKYAHIEADADAIELLDDGAELNTICEGSAPEVSTTRDDDAISASNLNSRGLLFARRGVHSNAMAEFSRAIQLDPTNETYFFNRAVSRRAQEDYHGALADFSEAIHLEPKPRSLNSRGLLFAQLGDHSKAIADFSYAIQIDPTYERCFFNRAVSRKAQKDYDGAFADFSEVIGLEPEDDISLLARGMLYARMGEHAKAIADFSLAIQLNPKEKAYFQNRAESRTAQADYAGAIADYSEAISLAPKDAC